ncbi:hypothetical protein NE237_003767 [Protea cynaroides]|uniref:Uncharacterized protein n=1 Tax=Protea cynaroides TaxID=273540 RepID=A0A9Q0KHC8_9MAGN|nr:hypothetical protein NE237_003767 [Protea cynaroides]
MRLPILNEENYAEWLELLELTLGYMNLNLAINEEKPEDLTDESTPDQRNYYAKWQRSNNMSLRLIKANMSRAIRRPILNKLTVREYLDSIKEQYVSTDSSTVSTLIAKLGAIKYNESKDVRDHIMKARDIAAQLKDYEIDLPEVYLMFCNNFVVMRHRFNMHCSFGVGSVNDDPLYTTIGGIYPLDSCVD